MHTLWHHVDESPHTACTEGRGVTLAEVGRDKGSGVLHSACRGRISEPPAAEPSRESARRPSLGRGRIPTSSSPRAASEMEAPHADMPRGSRAGTTLSGVPSTGSVEWAGASPSPPPTSGRGLTAARPRCLRPALAQPPHTVPPPVAPPSAAPPDPPAAAPPPEPLGPDVPLPPPFALLTLAAPLTPLISLGLSAVTD
uniref:Uncharacterized protein n=1 Tax=Haptolina brevifila TaxID=156173 RepID=A0A7S2JDP4_9EUKA|mmetsp:Transcript_80768/g.160477  ORF Transcript_80768/g.160477 Transcript_80768/m.160477 type:complete len:198 (+) Transcript_80768:177-770(+)